MRLNKLSREYRRTLAQGIVTASTLFLALEYGDVLDAILGQYINAGDGIGSKVLYVLLITGIIVLVNIIVQKWIDSKK